MYLNPDEKTFNGNYVKLESLDSKKHANDLFDSFINDQSIFEYMNFGPFVNKADFVDWLTRIEFLNDRLTYSVYSKRLEKYVGMYSIINIDVSNGKAELGSIWYGMEAQKSEINTESTYILLMYLFEKMNYRRIEWKCDNENIKSKNAALRLGFKFEGLFRKHMIIKNKNRDTAWFSIIDDEWVGLKNKFNDILIYKYENKGS